VLGSQIDKRHVSRQLNGDREPILVDWEEANTSTPAVARAPDRPPTSRRRQGRRRRRGRARL